MNVRKGVLWGLRGLGLWFALVFFVPFPHEKLKEHPQNIRYLDQEGGLLRRSLGEGGMDSDWISLEACGSWVGPALIAVEDQRFYQHAGVDPLAVVRAMGQNVLHMDVVSGASTLSTQVIRMIEPRPRNLRTKFIEAFRATQLELFYDKAFILEQYLNRAPFGGNRQGIASASRRYYGKEPEYLSAGEAALLMGLPQSPSRFRPDRAPNKAERRRETVLRRMQEEGMLTEMPILSEGRLWVEPPLRAFHFTEWIRRRYAVKGGGFHSTLDPGVQQQCEAILERKRSETLYAETDGVGIVVMDAQTGWIRAWVGGWDPEHPLHGNVDTVTRRRAPGSTLKPFAFAMAMEQGWLNPESRLEDLPQQYRDYRPQNMDERWSHDVSAQDALVRSLNMPALHIVGQLGVDDFLSDLRSAGMELKDVRSEDVGLGVVLGGGVTVSLLEMVEAYSVFARGGEGLVAQGKDQGLETRERVYSEGVAYWISRMLSGPERNDALYGHMGEVSRPALAFKTGTSHGARDAWAIGWNAQWVVGVWVGRMDGVGVDGLSGSRHAVPLLGEVVMGLMNDKQEPWPQAPESIQQWNGQEVVMGVTELNHAQPKVVQPRICSPSPESELFLLDDETIHVRLEAMGEGETVVHWFVNERWIGERKIHQPLVYSFSQGDYEIRAVFADGSAESRHLKVRKM
ncbi:transglycosylase domain-containing protein [Kiritimatiellota bacterium B12222]|nr:transglycosylase domain-containing protein [Kiritimatiellota bacterium B12222]